MVDVVPHAALSDALSNPSETGRRERKKLATRQALRIAALELVAERGFAHVTVEDIAEAADVSTRTFFNYFPSKEAAVIGLDPDRVESMRAEVLARPAEESPLEVIRATLLDHARSLESEIDDLGDGLGLWMRRMRVVRSEPELLSAFSAHIAAVERGLAEALAERLGRDPAHDPYPALVTASAFAAARVAGLYWKAQEGSGSLVALTAAALDALGAGLHEPAPPVTARRSRAGAAAGGRGAQRRPDDVDGE